MSDSVRNALDWISGTPLRVVVILVSACHKCNHLKADKHLKEIGWRLRQLPREPVGAAWRILGTGQTNAQWLQYLAPFGVAAATA